MSKIIITADIHFGVPGRLPDTLWASRVIREYCKAAGIDTCLILGDLFHDRTALGIDVLHHVCNFFEITKEQYGQQWVTFPGNHDMFLRHSWDINSLTILKKYLTVIEDLKVLMLDNRRFWVLPFVTYEKSFMRILRKIEEQYEQDDTLLTHIGVKGASLNACFLLKDWSVVNFEYSKFKRIYTGHFHNKQQVGDTVWYPGSPIPFKFDEGDISHGFYVYDLETQTHKFINIWKAGEKFFPNEVAPPQFCTFLDELLDQKTIADVRNNIVRVALQRDFTIDEKRVIKERLLEMGARAVRWMNLAQRLEKDSAEVLISNQRHRNMFGTWVENDKNGVKGLDLAVLSKAHEDVVHDGDELYAVEESEI